MIGYQIILGALSRTHIKLYTKIIKIQCSNRKVFFGLDKSYWPDGEGWAVEEVTLSTHSCTHIDAPYHYGSASNGERAKTIDQIPLNWCYGDGVLINMIHKQAGEGISIEDMQQELKNPYDIVLIYTGASKQFHQPGYEYLHAGLTASATEWLIDQGVNNRL